MSNGLKALLTRAEHDEMASFRIDDLHRWQLAHSVEPFLKSNPTPSYTRCPGCERDCTMEVAWHPVNGHPFIVCDKPQDLGRVWLENTELERWRLNFSALAACVATAIQGTPQEAIEGRLYFVGTFDGHGVCMAHGLGWPDGARLSAHVFLQRSTTILLALAPSPSNSPPCTVLPLADLLRHDGEAWRVDVQALRAMLPDAPHALHYAFRQEGQIWTLAYGGNTTRVKNTKGMGYLHTLIRCPNEDIAAMELAAPDAVASLRANRMEKQDMIDLQTRRDIQQKVALLESSNPNSPEISTLKSYLSGASHGGTAKGFSDDNERARQSVTKAITQAITNIEKHLPPMAEHLNATIKTGAFFRYAPTTRHIFSL